MYQPPSGESIVPTVAAIIREPLELLALAQGEGVPSMEAAGGFGWALAKTALLLLVVCVLAYVVIRFGLTRLQGGAGRAGGRLAVLDRLSVEPRRSLQVVRVGEKVLLIGVGDGGIGLLCELDPGEWFDAEPREARGGLKRALRRALEGAGGAEARESAGSVEAPRPSEAHRGTV
jgi:flagellar biosynthetic protein FliO